MVEEPFGADTDAALPPSPAYKTPRALALASEKKDMGGLWGCWKGRGLCSSCELPHPDTNNMADMEEGGGGGETRRWPKAGEFRWPTEHQAILLCRRPCERPEETETSIWSAVPDWNWTNSCSTRWAPQRGTV